MRCVVHDWTGPGDAASGLLVGFMKLQNDGPGRCSSSASYSRIAFFCDAEIRITSNYDSIKWRVWICTEVYRVLGLSITVKKQRKTVVEKKKKRKHPREEKLWWFYLRYNYGNIHTCFLLLLFSIFIDVCDSACRWGWACTGIIAEPR